MEQLDAVEVLRVVQEEEEMKVSSGPNAKHPGTKNSLKLAHRTEENLTPAMKIRRDRFIRQYVIDFNGTKAAIRAGMPARSAPKAASEMLREPYVQKELHKYILTVEENVLVSRNTVIAGLVREANDHSLGASHAARVNALGKLAEILGMKIDRARLDVTVNNGVMVVPLAESLNDWEQRAIETQEHLKHAVED